jgi:hypothetical protein
MFHALMATPQRRAAARERVGGARREGRARGVTFSRSFSSSGRRRGCGTARAAAIAAVLMQRREAGCSKRAKAMLLAQLRDWSRRWENAMLDGHARAGAGKDLDSRCGAERAGGEESPLGRKAFSNMEQYTKTVLKNTKN